MAEGTVISNKIPVKCRFLGRFVVDLFKYMSSDSMRSSKSSLATRECEIYGWRGPQSPLS